MANQKIYIGYHPEMVGSRTIEAYPPSPELFAVLRSSQDFTVGADCGEGYVGVFTDSRSPRDLARLMDPLLRSFFGDDVDAIPCTSAEFERVVDSVENRGAHTNMPVQRQLQKGMISFVPRDTPEHVAPQLQPKRAD